MNHLFILVVVLVLVLDPIPWFRGRGRGGAGGRPVSWSQCMRENERGLSMNPKVLPASCRRKNLREALPTRRRQHLVGDTVRRVRGSCQSAGAKFGVSQEAPAKPRGNCNRAQVSPGIEP